MLCSRTTNGAHSFRTTFDYHTAVFPHTNGLQKGHKNYEIDSTNDEKKAQKNSEKKVGRKGPVSTDGFRLYKSWPKKLDYGFSRKQAFSTDKSDCIRKAN